MSDENLKLKKRIEHWIQHNDEHSSRFKKEAENAESMGLKQVAMALRSAAALSTKVSQELRVAEENII